MITAVVALGWEMPKDSKISGCLMGSSMTSLISWKSTASWWSQKWFHHSIGEVLLLLTVLCHLAFHGFLVDFVCLDFPLSSRIVSLSCVHLFEPAPWSACLHHQSFHRCYLVSSPPSSTVPKDPPQVHLWVSPKLPGLWLHLSPNLERWCRSLPITFRTYGPSVHSNISHKVKGVKVY